MAYSWKFYLLVAHLVDEHGHTACNRQLPRTDEACGSVAESLKCATCKKYALKIRGTE
jgi:hypothetical protein